MDTIYTKNAPDAIGPYSQAVKVGEMLYTSGQIAINPATGKVEADDIVGQSKQVMANLKAVLEAAGTGFDKVVKTTCFLKDVARDFGAFNEVYAEAMGDAKPARSCVGVADLPKGGTANTAITRQAPNSPPSSQIIEKIISFCASGTKPSFCRPFPSPQPKILPLPIA